MRPDPALSLATLRALAPMVPADAAADVWHAWVTGRPLEAQRVMAHWGMERQAVEAAFRALSVTLLPD